MSHAAPILRLAAIVVAAASVVACEPKPGGASPAENAPVRVEPQATAAAVPRLVDLGAGKCIPCKAMAPILDQLRVDYAGRMEVQFIDVWNEPEQARAYGIDMIPTQIFYSADGRELARHEGFIGREEILAKWTALGVAL